MTVRKSRYPNKNRIKKRIKTLFSIGVLIQNITLTLLNPPIKLKTLQIICSRYLSRGECEADCELSPSHAPLSVDDLIRYRKEREMINTERNCGFMDQNIQGQQLAGSLKSSTKIIEHCEATKAY